MPIMGNVTPKGLLQHITNAIPARIVQVIDVTDNRIEVDLLVPFEDYQHFTVTIERR